VIQLWKVQNHLTAAGFDFIRDALKQVGRRLVILFALDLQYENAVIVAGPTACEVDHIRISMSASLMLVTKHPDCGQPAGLNHCTDDFDQRLRVNV